MNQRHLYTGLTYKHDLLESLVAIEPTHSVAEIGIGTGYSCFTLARKTAHVTGIDIDAGLITLLKEYAAEYANLELLCTDVITDTPPEEYQSRMDIVFSFDTLPFVASPERFLAYIQKLLKPEGRAVVCFPNEPDETMEGSVNFKRYESLLEVISAGGLHPESIQVVRHTQWFKFITRNFWYRMKRFAYPEHYDGTTFPEMFSDSIAFSLLKKNRGVSWPIRIYTAFVMKLIRAGGAYNWLESKNIYDRYLILLLSKKKQVG